MRALVQFLDKKQNRLRNTAHLHRQTERRGTHNMRYLKNRRTE